MKATEPPPKWIVASGCAIADVASDAPAISAAAAPNPIKARLIMRPVSVCAAPNRPAPMPADQRLRLHDQQYLTPGEEARQGGKDVPRRITGAPRLGLTFLIQRQLLAQEQILLRELGT